MSFHVLWPVLVVGILLLAGTLALLLLGRRRGVAEPWAVVARRIALAVLVLLIGLRPTVAGGTAQGSMTNVDLVIMVDRTTSMAAEDYNGGDQRMKGAQADIGELVRKFAGARYSVITFDTTARVELPFTTDGSAVIALARTIGWKEAFYGNGTSISLCVEPAQKMLDRSAEQFPKRSRVAVYLGDGEHTQDEAPATFEPLRSKLKGALVLGYGTAEGGRMKNSARDKSYVYDYGTHKDAISKIDENNLRSIATQLGGEYQHRTAPGAINFDVKDPGDGGAAGRKVTGFELYWVLGLLVAGLLLWEVWDAAGAYRAARKELR